MIIAIVQARLDSKRLPGKVLKPIKGKPLIAYMFERLRLARKLGRIIFAVPQKDRRKIAAAIPDATVWGITGAENDVWRRYMIVRNILVRSGMLPTAIVRLCADSPLIDPALIDQMLVHYDGRITTNTQPRSWPAGQCVEILPAKGLGRLENNKRFDDSAFDAMTAEDREHVTPWYYRNCRYTNIECPGGDFSAVRMCVDTQDDLNRIEETIGKMDRPHTEYGWRDIMELMA